MTPLTSRSPSQAPGHSWSRRILIISLAGILFLTLYPFRFSPHAKLPGHASPFLLGSSTKPGKPIDVLLNVLLFMPFGFGLSARLRERGVTGRWAWIAVWFFGALLSYAIEFTQIYFPPRDSGWGDVITNSTGSLLGGGIFLFMGTGLLRFFSRQEAAFETWLSPARAAILLGIYFGLWCFASVHWQRKSRLDNWDPASVFVVGNDATGRSPWKGTVYELEIWDRAIPVREGLRGSRGNDGLRNEEGLLADLTFSGAAPFSDGNNLLPPLLWTPFAPSLPSSDGVNLDGTSWITSEAAASELIRRLERTNQFSLRILLEAESQDSRGRILSITRPDGISDLSLQQDGGSLKFWFRNLLSGKQPLLTWAIPHVFASQVRQDLLFSYDGSDLSFYLDGNQEPNTYQLTPGTALAELLDRAKATELEGYAYIFYALVFFPLGALLGIFLRRKVKRQFEGMAVLVVTFCLAPIALELALTWVSGRPNSLQNLALSYFLILLGCLWVNADSRFVGRLPSISGG
jgi:VanZ family protein